MGSAISKHSSGTRAASVSKGFTNRDQMTHVFIAACGPDEFAWEHDKGSGGRFTEALLLALRKQDWQDMSYDSLMTHVKLSAV